MKEIEIGSIVKVHSYRGVDRRKEGIVAEVNIHKEKSIRVVFPSKSGQPTGIWDFKKERLETTQVTRYKFKKIQQALLEYRELQEIVKNA